MRRRCKAARPEAPLAFGDGCHPAYTGRPAYGWILRGATVELKFHHGRTGININGALSWPERSLIHRAEERITSAAMIRLFADLEARQAQQGSGLALRQERRVELGRGARHREEDGSCHGLRVA